MDYRSDPEYKRAMQELTEIDILVAQGVLGPEYCPESSYLHWPVLKPEELPQKYKTSYETFGEVRWYRQTIDLGVDQSAHYARSPHPWNEAWY